MSEQKYCDACYRTVEDCGCAMGYADAIADNRREHQLGLPTSWYYFEFENGAWTKEPDKSTKRYPSGGLAYVGSLNNKQHDELKRCVENFVHKCHNTQEVPKLLVQRTEAEWRVEFSARYGSREHCSVTPLQWDVFYGVFTDALRLVGAIKESGESFMDGVQRTSNEIKTRQRELSNELQKIAKQESHK